MSGEDAGYLIATMALSPKMVQRLTHGINFSFAIEPVKKSEIKEDMPGIVIEGGRKDTYIAGKVLVKDFRGGPAFWITGIMPKVDITEADRQLQRLLVREASRAADDEGAARIRKLGLPDDAARSAGRRAPCGP